MMIRFTLPLILIVLVFSVCNRKPPDNTNRSTSDSNSTNTDLSRETVESGIEVTFYPAYGYREGAMAGADWLIPMRTWVHEIADSTVTPGKRLEKLKSKAVELTTTSICSGMEGNALKSRLRDFHARDIHDRQVEIQFDSDPARERYQLGTSDRNGLISTNNLKLSDAKAQQLARDQHSTTGWLTFHATSDGLKGKGRIRLTEPEGTSVVTDIDDTIKISGVPAAKKVVLKNTFCCGLVGAPGMSKMYRSWGDNVAFHYVSGGPWQLYGPLYDYLIGGDGAYPEGTFHLRYLPKNILEEDTRMILGGIVSDAVFESMFGSLKGTYDHKHKQIIELMDNFPRRNFILVGDSGEIDPEVYRWFKNDPKYSKQVKEIWIRDVVNDAEVNRERLNGMNVIKAEPLICATRGHHKQVSAMVKSLSGNAYAQRCDQQRAATPASCP